MSRFQLWAAGHNPTGKPLNDFTEHTTHVRIVPLREEAAGEFICQLRDTSWRAATEAVTPQQRLPASLMHKTTGPDAFAPKDAGSHQHILEPSASDLLV